MIRFLLLGLFLCISHEPAYIKGEKFSGYIFSAEHSVLLVEEGNRFTPTEEDIMFAEKLIAENIGELNSKKTNQGYGCPVIHKSLRKYIRQYVGIINEEGQKTIWINLLWKNRFSDSQLKNDIITVTDGCSYYWSVTVNLNDTLVYDLNVNGRG